MGTFHDEMAAAVNLRKKAINGVLRWQAKRQEAEARIEELSSQLQAVENGVPAAVTEDGALISADLKPVFGISE